MIDRTKNKIGKISKKILEQINQEILKKINFNQRKNTSNVANGSIILKKRLRLHPIQYSEFYPSITEQVLEEAISFAKSLIDTEDHKIRTTNFVQ